MNHVILKPVEKNGNIQAVDTKGKVVKGIVREHMLQLALDNDQCIVYNEDTGKCYRKDIRLYDEMAPTEKEVEASEKIDADPVLAFIHNSPDLIPETMKI